MLATQYLKDFLYRAFRNCSDHSPISNYSQARWHDGNGATLQNNVNYIHINFQVVAVLINWEG